MSDRPEGDAAPISDEAGAALARARATLAELDGAYNDLGERGRGALVRTIVAELLVAVERIHGDQPLPGTAAARAAPVRRRLSSRRRCMSRPSLVSRPMRDG